MPPRLVIRQLADDSFEWMALDRGGRATSPPVAGLPRESAALVDLILPSEHALLLEAPRLAKRASQLAQALPYAIEEQLAGPVEQQHVAFLDRGQAASIAVAVIARERLQAVLGQLSGAGHPVDRCHTAAQLLPLKPGQLSVLVDGTESLLRWGGSAAISCRTADLVDAIALLRDGDAGFTQVRCWRTRGSQALQLDGLAVDDEVIDAALPWLAAQFPASGTPDLLQGEFRPRRRGGQLASRWRWAAILAVLACGLGLLQALVERAALERYANSRRAEMDQLLRDALPGTTRIVDPVAQLRAELERRGATGAATAGALPLLATVAPLIAGSGRYTIEALEYRGGTLELTINAPDVAALDGLRSALAAVPSLQVELTSALPGSNGYEGRLRIREGRS